jgi:hypothetical protein
MQEMSALRAVNRRVSALGLLVPIRSRLESDHALDSDTVRILTAAFEDAWREVHGDRIGSHMDAMRDKLARLIIAGAKAGERDPVKLRDSAIMFLRIAMPDKPDGLATSAAAWSSRIVRKACSRSDWLVMLLGAVCLAFVRLTSLANSTQRRGT